MNGNDDAYAQQMTNRDGKRLLNPVYDNSKWAKAAAACKDVMGLGVYHIYTADFRSTHSIAFPATSLLRFTRNIVIKIFQKVGRILIRSNLIVLYSTDR